MGGRTVLRADGGSLAGSARGSATGETRRRSGNWAADLQFRNANPMADTEGWLALAGRP
jgi:hypothetical protein